MVTWLFLFGMVTWRSNRQKKSTVETVRLTYHPDAGLFPRWIIQL